ncbi:tetratricopeptide repeat protein [Nisaea acidiphila]|uniref:protein O-GlcNAc transferase n=1 Tax=Nisaea acidiphila TaxID=1862145 RepID=A0A9J7AW64_9PROT|nr:tetratricopeptide repeat protein [Nisaea acidiphila]UUX52035.1 tetratricopeptide repeat protein [Nisaea acidiphila]
MQVRGLLIAAHGLHQAGRIAEAVSGYRRVLTAAPAEADSWHLLGTAMLQASRPGPAAACISKGLVAHPARHDFRLNLGFALIDSGRIEEAASVLDTACRQAPGEASYWSACAAARKRLGDQRGTEKAYRAALVLAPADSTSLYNLALALQENGDAERAASLYGRTLSFDPLNRTARANRAQALKSLDKVNEAIREFRRALVLSPDDATLLNDLGILLWAEKCVRDAIDLYSRAMTAAPERAEIARNLTGALASSGRYETALEVYGKAIETHPEDPGFPVRRAFALPVIARDLAQIDEARLKIAGFLASPDAERIRLSDPLTEVGAANFYLVYHGRNDRTLAEGISAFYRRACPALNFIAPHCADGPKHGDKIELGICSKYLAGHTIGAVFGELVTGFDRDRFRLTLLRPPGLRDAAAAKIAAGFDRVVELPADIGRAATVAAECHLDALLYTDIGMEPFTYFLAHTRLAPVQWATWGHPVTTGISTVDVYLSPDCFEPEGADAHYAERLVRSPSIPMVYRDGPVPPPAEKSAFGLPENGPLYLCPQNLFKLHPDYDHVFADILRRDTRGTLGLIEGANPEWTERLKTRLQTVLGSAMERVRFLPYLPKNEYMRLLGAAEVMLDPIHFGGSNTTLGGFAAGTPVITWPGPYMRGRMTAGLYRTMGIEDCIAADHSDYAAKAVEIANDPAWRADVAQRIREARPAVVGTTGASDDLGNLLAEAVSSRSGSR